MGHNGIFERLLPAAAVIIAVAAFALPTHLRAQDAGSSGAVKQKTRRGNAATVTLEITFADGTVGTVTQIESQPITITENNSTIALVPTFATEGAEVNLAVFDLASYFSPKEHRTKAGLGLDKIGSLDFSTGDWIPAEFVHGQWQLHVRLLQTGKAPSGSLDGSGQQIFQIGEDGDQIGGVGRTGGSCCVTCSYKTICGCSVTMECGSCCGAPCC
ncbi:MAG: hypothetical protein DMF61_00720 [Blastocatellia bacterium AA13]|nr:MAG: hypothetical protein DMF61_00720 [Blastocatellia bacterium AA13]